MTGHLKPNPRFVASHRVRPVRQQRSSLGRQAPHESVFLGGRSATPGGEFTEVGSGGTDHGAQH